MITIAIIIIMACHNWPHFRALFITLLPRFRCRFADIPFPTSEDWEAATGKVFPKTFSHTVRRRVCRGLCFLYCIFLF